MSRKKSLKLSEESSEDTNQPSSSLQAPLVSPLQRFVKSMEIGYEKWHDGIGYNIDAIELASIPESEEKRML